MIKNDKSIIKFFIFFVGSLFLGILFLGFFLGFIIPNDIEYKYSLSCNNLEYCTYTIYNFNKKNNKSVNFNISDVYNTKEVYHSISGYKEDIGYYTYNIYLHPDSTIDLKSKKLFKNFQEYRYYFLLKKLKNYYDKIQNSSLGEIIKIESSTQEQLKDYNELELKYNGDLNVSHTNYAKLWSNLQNIPFIIGCSFGAIMCFLYSLTFLGFVCKKIWINICYAFMALGFVTYMIYNAGYIFFYHNFYSELVF